MFRAQITLHSWLGFLLLTFLFAGATSAAASSSEPWAVADSPARLDRTSREAAFATWRASVAAGTPEVGARLWECAMCPEMIVAPSGSFTIGSPANEVGRGNDEGPQRRIEIGRVIAVSRFEVTRAEYENFLTATAHPVGGNCITDRVQRGNWVPNADTNLRDPGFAQADDHPVVCVSWNDASAYVAWLNRQTPGGYRLLSEAEWEYLDRAGSTTAYPWGSSADQGCTQMNGSDTTLRAKYPELDVLPSAQASTCSDGALNTAPVGAYRANAFGIHDMTGNVSEWTQDCATPSYDGMAADGTPARGDCARRMVRGGSWGTYSAQLRSAERLRYAPNDRDDSIGIRVARTIP